MDTVEFAKLKKEVEARVNREIYETLQKAADELELASGLNVKNLYLTVDTVEHKSFGTADQLLMIGVTTKFGII